MIFAIPFAIPFTIISGDPVSTDLRDWGMFVLIVGSLVAAIMVPVVLSRLVDAWRTKDIDDESDGR